MNGQSIATNTLLMPNIPQLFFEYTTALDFLRMSFEQHGSIHAFIVMKGFRRLMIIYDETLCAVKAHEALDKKLLMWDKPDSTSTIRCHFDNTTERADTAVGTHMEIRLFYGQHNPINPDPALLQLQVPENKRNFLISPPGSPCKDWKQTAESPPNTAVLASDLTHTIAELPDDDLDDLDNFQLDASVSHDQDLDNPVTSIQPATFKIVTRAEDGDQNKHLPSITVQDWDGCKSSVPEKHHGDFPKATLIHTARPPI